MAYYISIFSSRPPTFIGIGFDLIRHTRQPGEPLKVSCLVIGQLSARAQSINQSQTGKIKFYAGRGNFPPFWLVDDLRPAQNLTFLPCDWSMVRASSSSSTNHKGGNLYWLSWLPGAPDRVKTYTNAFGRSRWENWYIISLGYYGL